MNARPCVGIYVVDSALTLPYTLSSGNIACFARFQPFDGMRIMRRIRLALVGDLMLVCSGISMLFPVMLIPFCLF